MKVGKQYTCNLPSIDVFRQGTYNASANVQGLLRFQRADSQNAIGRLNLSVRRKKGKLSPYIESGIASKPPLSQPPVKARAQSLNDAEIPSEPHRIPPPLSPDPLLMPPVPPCTAVPQNTGMRGNFKPPQEHGYISTHRNSDLTLSRLPSLPLNRPDLVAATQERRAVTEPQNRSRASRSVRSGVTRRSNSKEGDIPRLSESVSLPVRSTSPLKNQPPASLESSMNSSKLNTDPHSHGLSSSSDRPVVTYVHSSFHSGQREPTVVGEFRKSIRTRTVPLRAFPQLPSISLPQPLSTREPTVVSPRTNVKVLPYHRVITQIKTGVFDEPLKQPVSIDIPLNRNHTFFPVRKPFKKLYNTPNTQHTAAGLRDLSSRE